MEAKTAVSFTDVQVGYGEKSVLSGVSFSVDEGEFLTVIGPNGVGKTTLIKCLCGIITDWKGEIAVFGTPLRQYSYKNLAKLISYVPQSGTHSFPFTVWEFTLMGRYSHQTPFSTIGPQDKAIVEDALRVTDSLELADRSMASLSGGERQKVYIAAALAQGSPILVLDEPTTFLDYKHQEEVAVLLHTLNKTQGRTIIAVTHDLSLAIRLSDRIVALKGGGVAFNGTSQELTESPALGDIFDTRFQFLKYADGGVPIFIPNERAE